MQLVIRKDRRSATVHVPAVPCELTEAQASRVRKQLGIGPSQECSNLSASPYTASAWASGVIAIR